MRSPNSTRLQTTFNRASIVAWILLAACSALTSCATSTPRAQVAPPSEVLELLSPLPGPDPALLQPCPELPPLVNDLATTMAVQSIHDARQYFDCKSRHRGLSDYEHERQKQEAARIERAAKALKGK